VNSENPGTIGRFAPSPTGPLHFGSLLAAVGSYLFARAAGGRWIVRIEDLDPPRVVPGSEAEILKALETLGLEWDGPVMRQSERSDAYEAALATLRSEGYTFDCACSRAEIRRAASAPSVRDPVDPSGAIYPGTCRDGLPEGRAPRATRFRAPDRHVQFSDALHGVVSENVAQATGDFVVKRADGIHAYQLAVVVDDLAQGVTQVVRGRDLLDSTARQIAIIEALGGTPPMYAHLPLVIDWTHEKLSKRNGALPVETLNETSGSRAVFDVLRILGQRDIQLDTATRMLSQAIATFDATRISTEDVELPASLSGA